MHLGHKQSKKEEPKCYYLSKSSVNKPPPWSLTRPLREQLPISRTFYYIPLGIPNKHGLLIKTKSHLSLKAVCKWAPPFHVPPAGPLWRQVFHFQSQWFIHSFISLRPQLRSSPTKCRENIRSPPTEPHADGWSTYSGVWPGFQSGSLTTLQSPSQCHAAFSTTHPSLAWIDLNPVSQCVS